MTTLDKYLTQLKSGTVPEPTIKGKKAAQTAAKLDRRPPDIAFAIGMYGDLVPLGLGRPCFQLSVQGAQKIVGGTVRMLKLPENHELLPGAQLLVNEEAELQGLPPNFLATLLFNYSLLGHVIVLSGSRRWS